MPKKTVQIPNIGEVTLIKNKRSKRIRLYVKPNQQVFVSIPFLASYKTAVNFAKENTTWIKKQQSKLNSGLTKYTLNSVIFTKSHVVKIKQHDASTLKSVNHQNEVTVFISSNIDINTPDAQEFITKIIAEVYRVEAKNYLPKRISELANKFGFKHNRITIRNNKSNWGSCSGNNNISLNLHLMKLPDHLIDYILLHELAHTLEKNHGPKFYEILNKVTNNKALELRKEVKNYSTYTF